MGGSGWCNHPDRKTTSDVRILVRAAELACRNTWGHDLWASADDSAADEPDASMRQPSLPAPTPDPTAYDDEVTSVISADAQLDDQAIVAEDIVQQSTIRIDDEFDPEQDRRLQLLSRDSRSAIRDARERAIARRTKKPVTDNAAEPSDDESPAATTDEPFTTRGTVFTPDDFVEDEAPSATDDVGEDDVIDQSISSGSPRGNRLRREADNPKDERAAVSTDAPSASSERQTAATPDRYNSVPELVDHVDLEAFRPQPVTRAEAPAPLPANPPAEDAYERALARARQIAQQPEQRDARPSFVNLSMPDLPEFDAPAPVPVAETTPAQPVSTSKLLHGNAPGMAPRTTGPQDARARRAAVPTHPALTPEEGRRSLWRGNRPEQKREQRIADAQRQRQRELVEASARKRAFDAERRHRAVEQPPAEPVPTPEVRDVAPVRQAAPAARRRPAPEPARRAAAAPIRRPANPERVSLTASAVSRADAAPANPIMAARDLMREQRRPARPRVLADDADPQLDRRTMAGVQAAIEPAPMAEQRPLRRRPADAPRPEARQFVPPPVDAYLDDGDLGDVIGDLAFAPVAHDQRPEPERDFLLDESHVRIMIPLISIAPDVPRQCATCRHYRASEQGGRGWCTNTWAFSHRQMVNEDDLPCSSSIGCWWLPADDEVWDTDEPAAHGPTPRVDRMLARKRGQPDERPSRKTAGE